MKGKGSAYRACSWVDPWIPPPPPLLYLAVVCTTAAAAEEEEEERKKEKEMDVDRGITELTNWIIIIIIK